MGNKYLDLGKYEEAKKYYQESKTFSKKCANKDLEAQAILNLADLCWEICDFASSVEYAKEGYTLSEAIKELDNLAYSLAIQGSTYLQQGEYSLALEKLQLAIKDSEKLDSDWNMPFMCADTAICLLELGRNKESLEYAQRAIEYKKDNVKYGYALCALGRVTARLQGNSDAKKYFEESLMKLSEVGHKNFHSQAQYYWAEILLQTQSASDRNEALVLLQDAYVEFKKLGIKHRMDLVKDLMSKQKLDLIL
jgi:tetratricopeptide (TPR) repeat protein